MCQGSATKNIALNLNNNKTGLQSVSRTCGRGSGFSKGQSGVSFSLKLSQQVTIQV